VVFVVQSAARASTLTNFFTTSGCSAMKSHCENGNMPLMPLSTTKSLKISRAAPVFTTFIIRRVQHAHVDQPLFERLLLVGIGNDDEVDVLVQSIAAQVFLEHVFRASAEAVDADLLAFRSFTVLMGLPD